MSRERHLPLSDEWTDPDVYVDSLLTFATSSDLFRNLCGGVHILDFLTREPDLYSTLLPEDWRAFFEEHYIHDILDLFLREDIRSLRDAPADSSWRGGPRPPSSLLEYVNDIQRLSLKRDFNPPPTANGGMSKTMPKRLSVGMKPKKRHEVENFARYVDSLSASVAELRGEDISHIVDFGAGQNFLGRMLASPPFNKHIIAIEQRHQNINGARGMDVLAKLAEKEAVSAKKSPLQRRKELVLSIDDPQSQHEKKETPMSPMLSQDTTPKGSSNHTSENEGGASGDDLAAVHVFQGIDLEPNELAASISRNRKNDSTNEEEEPTMNGGAVDYIEHEIKDGYLEPIIKHVVSPEPGQEDTPTDTRVMVVSLHSCGNLLHHGVRSLVLNPSVVAVAMVGCCYNLMTERLGPASYKLPVLRSLHPRLVKTSVAYDPHGFPMSKRLEDFPHASGKGMKLNITARTMAVQAPNNWGRKDSEAFFTRHFYRALLQRILLDKEVVPKPVVPSNPYEIDPDSSGGTALIVGSLRKTAFVSFQAYVRAAVEKLVRLPDYGEKIRERILGISDEELKWYEDQY